MTATAVGVPPKEELLERAEALEPLLVRDAPQAEETRRIPEESIAALTEAGLSSSSSSPSSARAGSPSCPSAWTSACSSRAWPASSRWAAP